MASWQFIVVRDVLDDATVESLRDMLLSDQRRRETTGEIAPGGMVKDAIFDPTHTLMDHDAFQSCICPVRLLPKVVDLMGWNIYLYHAQFFINPAQDSEPPQPEAQKTLGFHQWAPPLSRRPLAHLRTVT